MLHACFDGDEEREETERGGEERERRDRRPSMRLGCDEGVDQQGGSRRDGEPAGDVVAERRRDGARDASADGLGGVASLLHRDRREAGEGDHRPVGLADPDHVADGEDLGMAGEREVRLDRHATRAIRLEHQSVRAVGERGGAHGEIAAVGVFVRARLDAPGIQRAHARLAVAEDARRETEAVS